MLGRASAGPRADTVTVVVAATDTPRFATLTADHLKTREYPVGLAPRGAMTKPEEVVGRVALTALTNDGPVLESKLAPAGAGRGMAAAVPLGMRAFTIRTPNVATGVAGFILPGNKVDVLLTVT